jgi:peroxiredoxin
MRAAFDCGQTFPDFVLPDHTKTPRRLSQLQGDDPLLLVLIRGFFCPKDREQLRALTRFHAQRADARWQLAVITCDEWRVARTLRRQLGATFPFLSDAAQHVRDELNIAACARGASGPMMPHTLLLAPGLRIRAVWNGHYGWSRPSVCELHDALQALDDERPVGRDALHRQPHPWQAGDRVAFDRGTGLASH